jgi:hypothetical protein
MVSFMHARSQRYELELRYAPPEVQIVELPRPRDTRDLFDFSGAAALIDEAYELSSAELDRIEREARDTVVDITPTVEAVERRRRWRLRRGA